MDASLMAVEVTWGFVRLRFHCAIFFEPTNQAMSNATSGAHAEGIVRRNLDCIDARQAIGLSYMAKDFCYSSATSDVSDASWCDLSHMLGL
jgi:hypothetical protein